MNALKDLTSGMGCSVDGTVQTANPLTGLVNQALGLNTSQFRHPQQQHQPHRNAAQSEMERAMAAGMGLSQRPDSMRQRTNRNIINSGVYAPGGTGVAFAQEFAQQQQQHQHLLGHQQGNTWVNDFQRLNLQQHQHHGPQFFHPSERSQQWGREMNQMPNFEMEQAWARNNAQRGNDWASQLEQQKAKEEEEQEAAKDADMMEATRRATEDMVRVMSDNPKFRNSGFFDFMQKVSQGELAFENNEVVQGPRAAEQQHPDPLAAAWAQANEEQSAVKQEDDLSAAWAASQEQANRAMGDLFQNFGDMNEGDIQQAWSKMMEQAQMADGDYDFDQHWMNQSPLQQPYEMEQNNPYAAHSAAFQEGLALFHAGRLQEAVLAFQAVVQKEPAHSEAWRMLGVVHQENDEDKRAIQCLERAVEQDAYNLDALLGLGVSYVNELDHSNALKNLKMWVNHNPKFVGLEVQRDEYSDGSMMDEVMQLMLKAAEHAPKDAGVHEVLGVLFNVTRDYPSASAAFRRAVDSHPDSYSLWNKCGATLANSTPSRSEEAIPAYLRAIELRPGYARAHLNLGISYNNLGNFNSAARAYLKAIELSPTATHIWQYLKISLTCMERPDLVALCEAKDLNALKRAF